MLCNESGPVSQRGLDAAANDCPADPSAHLSVPLAPADCDGVFISLQARGIYLCTQESTAQLTVRFSFFALALDPFHSLLSVRYMRSFGEK